MAFKGTKKGITDLSYEVIAKHGKLGEPDKQGYQYELREVSWNGRPEKYDIRPWKEEEDGTESMRKGICLDGSECEDLYELLKVIAESEE